ncbi:hypothetical protein ACFCZ1_05485 [Streptomyces sp. NPDC056224]|uniref:hypothetical protein n=1 Tax=Streptomyces sp. NPDC056224 TaxID=3345750 RepID=UPI0035D9AE2F
MGETARPETDRDAGRVAGLLHRSHAALESATAAVAAVGAPDFERRMAVMARTLRAFRSEAADIASAGLGGSDQETDRQSVLTALYVTEDAGRIGVLIEQVGDIAGARESGPPLAETVREPVRDLGEACLRLMARAGDVLHLTAPSAVLDRDLADIAVRQLALSRLLLTGGPLCPVSDAVDAAVLGRCYEECAQRAAAMARTADQLRGDARRP